MSKEIYYKIVTPELRSISWEKVSIFSIQYKEKEFVNAPNELFELGYGLTVFKDMKSLKNFIKNTPIFRLMYRIYSCETRDEIPIPKQGGIRFSPSSYSQFKKFITEYEDVVLNWPEGTLMARSVKLLKKLR